MSNSPSLGGAPLFSATLLREILNQCQSLIACLEYLRDDQESMRFQVLDQVVRRDAHELATLARKVHHNNLVELCNYSPLVFRGPEEVLNWAVQFETWCEEYLVWLDTNSPADAAQATSSLALGNQTSESNTSLPPSVTEGMPPQTPPQPTDVLASPAELAKLCRVPQGALEARLKRWRGDNPGQTGIGFITVTDRKPRQAEFLYYLHAVQHIIDDLRASGERRAKK